MDFPDNCTGCLFRDSTADWGDGLQTGDITINDGPYFNGTKATGTNACTAAEAEAKFGSIPGAAAPAAPDAGGDKENSKTGDSSLIIFAALALLISAGTAVFAVRKVKA